VKSKFAGLQKKFTNWRKSFGVEINSHLALYIILVFIFITAFFVRVYRVGDLMWFYYDQGRDALRIWEFWHQGKPFLVGPVTGLAGIFLGPFYYYLIAPFYLLGGGNPVYPAVFLAFLSTIALAPLYILGWKMHSRATGLIATIIVGFSYYLVLAGRWLANPTPILLTSILLLFSMWRISLGKNKYWWLVITLLIGISLQLEAASAVFYLPMILIFAVWQRKNLPNVKTAVVLGILFLVTLLPQIVFDFRHEHILLNNFKRVLLEEKSFRTPLYSVLDTRLRYFWNVYNSKIFPGREGYAKLFTTVSLIALISSFKKKKTPLTLLIIFLGIPMLGYIFFQGNFGNIYDYYMTGYFLPMMLLLSLGFGILWEDKLGKIAVTAFFVLFLMINVTNLKNYLIAGVDGPTHITLGNEKQAVNWIFDDAGKKRLQEFNVETYVPPVISHSYDYLYLWLGTKRCGKGLCGLVKDRNTEIFYALYEVDPPHPERLAEWLGRYGNSTIIEEQEKFGGITVERRKRI